MGPTGEREPPPLASTPPASVTLHHLLAPQFESYHDWLLCAGVWVFCAKAENPETETIDPDTIVIPSDAQSKQLLDLEVEDAAIEDTIFELGKAYERADEVVNTYF